MTARITEFSWGTPAGLFAAPVPANAAPAAPKRKRSRKKDAAPVSDADAERVATELAGPPVESPAAAAYAPVDPVAFFTSGIEPAEPRACGACARIGTNDTSVRAHSPSCPNDAPPAPVPAEPAAAFPIMLPDRSWGASVDGDAVVGHRVRVTARSGKSWLATVTEVHFARAGRTIVTAAGDDPPEARTSSPRGGRGRRGGGRGTHMRVGGRDFFQNAKGRCIDAPCCGCCT